MKSILNLASHIHLINLLLLLHLRDNRKHNKTITSETNAFAKRMQTKREWWTKWPKWLVIIWSHTIKWRCTLTNFHTDTVLPQPPTWPHHIRRPMCSVSSLCAARVAENPVSSDCHRRRRKSSDIFIWYNYLKIRSKNPCRPTLSVMQGHRHAHRLNGTGTRYPNPAAVHRDMRNFIHIYILYESKKKKKKKRREERKTKSDGKK